MNIRRIVGVAALGAATTSLVMVPGAGAQEPEPVTYAASSSGQALALSVFGEGLTIGSTLAELDSSVQATAEGVGLATPVFEGGLSSATVQGSGTDGSTEPVCEGSFAEIPGLSIALACSSSLAEIVDGTPRSVATGSVGDIVVNPVNALLDTPLAEVVAPVEDGVNQLLEGLRPVTTAVDDATDLGLESTLSELFGTLFDGADLVGITLGNTQAESVVTADAVRTTCAASGGRVDVLDAPPVGGIDPEPVISVIIGDALSQVEVTTTDTTATPTINPAIATVVVPALGINEGLAVGQTIEIPLPEPLGTSTITIADGVTGTTDDGQTFATANAVELDLLNGESLMGGVELSLAQCNSVAGAVLPVQVPREDPTPQPQLPRTGGESSNGLALAAAVGLGGLGLALLRRTRTA